jgi:hypothetical protein
MQGKKNSLHAGQTFSEQKENDATNINLKTLAVRLSNRRALFFSTRMT